MRKIVFLLFVAVVWVACNDDKETFFGASLPRENLSFESIPGGAIMRYKLDSDAVFGIQAIYMNERGERVLKQGTYLSDSIIFDGFNRSHQGVPVWISLVSERGDKVEVLETNFDTEESPAFAFFNEAEVLPYWGGFQLTYSAFTGGVSGYATVFYVGINPQTNDLDTLPLATYPIKEGGDILHFLFKEERTFNTVMVRTEDFKGNIARQRVWENVEVYHVEKLDNTDFELLDPFGLSVEDELQYKMGTKYLFDGDIKGHQLQMSLFPLPPRRIPHYTFTAGPFAVSKEGDERYFIMDIKEPMNLAFIRLYAILYHTGVLPPNYWGFGGGSKVYGNKLPNEVTVYASNDKEDSNSWIKLGHYHESLFTPYEQRWYYFSQAGESLSIDAFNELPPLYMDISFLMTGTKYRYYKVEINGVFDTDGTNPTEYVTFHEIEAYGQK